MADNQQPTGITRTHTTGKSVPVPWNLINLAPDADGHEVLAARLAERRGEIRQTIADAQARR